MIDCRDNCLSLKIGQLGVSIVCPDDLAYSRLIVRYPDFKVDTVQDWQIQLFYVPGEINVSIPAGFSFIEDRMYVVEADGWGWVSVLDKKGELHLGLQASTGTVDYFLRAVFALQAFEVGGFILHAAGVVQDDKAFVFFGHSGSGKTTVARLSPIGSILNDDLLVFLPRDQEWIVYGTPFTNPTQIPPMNKSARLAGLYLLIQDHSVYLEALTSSRAIAELFSCLPVITTDSQRSECLLSRLQDILAKYPVNGLHFMQNSSFWAII